MTTRTLPTESPAIVLPTGMLITAVLAACSIVSVFWIGIAWQMGWDNQVIIAGPVGGAAVALTGILGVLIMTPWRPRDMGMWMTMWMAATVLRLLLTPALAYLLYSATSLSGTALGLAIVFSYFLALLAEWVVLDRHINKVLPL